MQQSCYSNLAIPYTWSLTVTSLIKKSKQGWEHFFFFFNIINKAILFLYFVEYNSTEHTLRVQFWIFQMLAKGLPDV